MGVSKKVIDTLFSISKETDAHGWLYAMNITEKNSSLQRDFYGRHHGKIFASLYFQSVAKKFPTHPWSDDAWMRRPDASPVKTHAAALCFITVPLNAYTIHVENYEFLKEKNLGNYVKYNMFHQEQKRNYKKMKFGFENFSYDSENDHLYVQQAKSWLTGLQNMIKVTVVIPLQSEFLN